MKEKKNINKSADGSLILIKLSSPWPSPSPTGKRKHKERDLTYTSTTRIGNQFRISRAASNNGQQLDNRNRRDVKEKGSYFHLVTRTFVALWAHNLDEGLRKTLKLHRDVLLLASSPHHHQSERFVVHQEGRQMDAAVKPQLYYKSQVKFNTKLKKRHHTRRGSSNSTLSSV